MVAFQFLEKQRNCYQKPDQLVLRQFVLNSIKRFMPMMSNKVGNMILRYLA